MNNNTQEIKEMIDNKRENFRLEIRKQNNDHSFQISREKLGLRSKDF